MTHKGIQLAITSNNFPQEQNYQICSWREKFSTNVFLQLIK